MFFISVAIIIAVRLFQKVNQFIVAAGSRSTIYSFINYGTVCFKKARCWDWFWSLELGIITTLLFYILILPNCIMNGGCKNHQTRLMVQTSNSIINRRFIITHCVIPRSALSLVVLSQAFLIILAWILCWWRRQCLNQIVFATAIHFLFCLAMTTLLLNEEITKKSRLEKEGGLIGIQLHLSCVLTTLSAHSIFFYSNTRKAMSVPVARCPAGKLLMSTIGKSSDRKLLFPSLWASWIWNFGFQITNFCYLKVCLSSERKSVMRAWKKAILVHKIKLIPTLVFPRSKASISPSGRGLAPDLTDFSRYPPPASYIAILDHVRRLD